MRYRFRLAAALAVALCGSVSAADWPQWRGPRGTGDLRREEPAGALERHRERRVEGGDSAGVGVSSPIVSGDRVFVTSQIGTGVRTAGQSSAARAGRDRGGRRRARARGAGARRRTTARSSSSRRSIAPTAGGLWQYRVEAAGPLPGVHDKHNLASPSPVTDGQMVYAWFGTGQIVALDMSGKVVWERHLGKEISPFEINWGHASSPTLYRGLADPAVRSRAGFLSARGRQEDRQGALEGRSRQGADVVHHAVRRRDAGRAGADRQLERARRRVRSADRRVPVARRRARISFPFRCRPSTTA